MTIPIRSLRAMDRAEPRDALIHQSRKGIRAVYLEFGQSARQNVLRHGELYRGKSRPDSNAPVLCYAEGGDHAHAAIPTTSGYPNLQLLAGLLRTCTRVGH
jgi:hypothetical protein